MRVSYGVSLLAGGTGLSKQLGWLRFSTRSTATSARPDAFRSRRSTRMTVGGDERDTKAARRAARVTVGEYHAARLAELIEHVRGALARYDAGEIDAFDLDEVIHQYKRAAQEWGKFCVGGGSQ